VSTGHRKLLSTLEKSYISDYVELGQAKEQEIICKGAPGPPPMLNAPINHTRSDTCSFFLLSLKPQRNNEIINEQAIDHKVCKFPSSDLLPGLMKDIREGACCARAAMKRAHPLHPTSGGIFTQL
jgi:hypothetical protein